jgi:hypothetical protein
MVEEPIAKEPTAQIRQRKNCLSIIMPATPQLELLQNERKLGGKAHKNFLIQS